VKAISLGFKAFDLHELTCHFVARHAGLYRANGLGVTLLDTRFVPDDALPDSVFSAACGSAVLRWLRGDKVKVVFAATDKPMFWLYSRVDLDSLDKLRGHRIAAHPDAAPPARFLRIVLEDAGVNPDSDVHLDPVPDDAARLQRLRSGDAAAALIGSTTLPGRIEALGFLRLLCLGDRIRLPTTGLAVSSAMQESDPETVAAMRNAFFAAIRLVHTDGAVLREALREARVIDDRDLDCASALVRRFFTADGLVRSADIIPGVRRLAASLCLPLPADVGTLYDCISR
jgi:ABC-type nitrate/sulfonate/bicarbonate transport system substrate-binding protein